MPNIANTVFLLIRRVIYGTSELKSLTAKFNEMSIL